VGAPPDVECALRAVTELFTDPAVPSSVTERAEGELYRYLLLILHRPMTTAPRPPPRPPMTWVRTPNGIPPTPDAGTSQS
jgi:hypothetical protein